MLLAWRWIIRTVFEKIREGTIQVAKCHLQAMRGSFSQKRRYLLHISQLPLLRVPADMLSLDALILAPKGAALKQGDIVDKTAAASDPQERPFLFFCRINSERGLRIAAS